MLDTNLSPFYLLSHLILHLDEGYYCCHFADEKTEAQRDKSLGYTTTKWWHPDLNPDGLTPQPVHSISQPVQPSCELLNEQGGE